MYGPDPRLWQTSGTVRKGPARFVDASCWCSDTIGSAWPRTFRGSRFVEQSTPAGTRVAGPGVAAGALRS